MTKKIIGISANETEDSGEKLHNMPINYLPAGYVKGIQLAGGLPLLLPVGTKEDAKLYINKIDKLVLTGGQNVNPKWYGEKREFNADLMLTSRDEFELALIEEALIQNKPIFAVCRGMQLLNVALGGTLYQDLSQRKPETVIHMQDPVRRQVATHSVTTNDNSVVRVIYGLKTMVNSFHFQAIKDLGKGLKITALSEDNIVEAVESTMRNQRIVGIQWHPDFAYEELKQERQMFRFVVDEL